MSEQHTQTQHFAKTWQQQLAAAFTNIDDLCRYLNLSPDDLPVSARAAQQFPLRVPLSFAADMEKGNPNDPLLKQVLPINDELISFAGFSADPVGDLSAVAHTGILHKYHGRILLINTGSCAINCRYCFRRNFPYADLHLSKQQEHAVFNYLAANPDITEVILSGGDPLLLSDSRLAQLIERLNAVEQLKRIRIHSRLPIVLPARVTAELIHTLATSGKKIIVVVHCNHANEINARVITAIQQLKTSGITLLNQSVLLKGVNDNAAVLCDLSERLFDNGILPYYLHLLDKATGTGHFEVSRADALALMQQVQATLSGYLVPKLVTEQAGENAKVRLL